MHTPFYHNPHPFTCPLFSTTLAHSTLHLVSHCCVLFPSLTWSTVIALSHSIFNIQYLLKIKQWCFTQLYKFTMYIRQVVIVHHYLLMNYHYPPSPLLFYLDLHLVCQCRELRPWWIRSSWSTSSMLSLS